MFSRIGERSHVESDESKNNKKTAAAKRKKKTLNENSFMEMLELGNVENDGKENRATTTENERKKEQKKKQDERYTK